MNDEVIAKFAQSLRGPVIGRNHPEYEEARKLYNAMIDKRPLLIARCVDVADVIAAVNFGRDNKLPIAIRGGGHNGPGLGSVDDGLVIDLSMMKGVRVDPKQKTVRVGAGCTTGDVDHATHAFGQAVPFGIISTTGVAGLTLSGGHGYLSRQYGLAVDNLIEADVVLADGSFVTASETENADLLWALRGGGGNFGVVTSFLFRTNPASMIYGGPIIFDLADAPAVMRWYREFQPKAPDEFYIFLGLQIGSARPILSPRSIGRRRCASSSSRTTGRSRRARRPSTPSARRCRSRSSIGRGRCPTRRCKRCSTGSTRKACNVLEGRFREGRCRTRRSTRMSRTPPSCRARFPACTSIRSTARSIGRSRTRPPGIAATRPGRWSSSESIPIRRRPRR